MGRPGVADTDLDDGLPLGDVLDPVLVPSLALLALPDDGGQGGGHGLALLAQPLQAPAVGPKATALLLPQAAQHVPDVQLPRVPVCPPPQRDSLDPNEVPKAWTQVEVVEMAGHFKNLSPSVGVDDFLCWEQLLLLVKWTPVHFHQDCLKQPG